MPSLPQLAAKASTAPRATKTAQSTTQSAANIVPQGGLFWDGRVDTLQQQAMGPMLSPLEIDGGSIDRVAAKLRAAPYADRFTQLFGANILNEPDMLVSEALFAVARYQVEAQDFHPFTSKYDAWLEGKARLTSAEMRGYILFNDPKKGDCAACHLDQPSPDGQPPLFTDHQYEALGVPRNPDLTVNKNPAYFDVGICGPYRTDLASQTQFCGMFLTPTLRDAATRKVFFHNGMYHSLKMCWISIISATPTQTRSIPRRRMERSINSTICQGNTGTISIRPTRLSTGIWAKRPHSPTRRKKTSSPS